MVGEEALSPRKSSGTNRDTERPPVERLNFTSTLMPDMNTTLHDVRLTTMILKFFLGYMPYAGGVVINWPLETLWQLIPQCKHAIVMFSPSSVSTCVSRLVRSLPSTSIRKETLALTST